MKNNIPETLMSRIVQYYVRPETEIISIEQTSLRDVIIEFPVHTGDLYKKNTMTLNLYRITEKYYHIAVETHQGHDWMSFDEVLISTIENIEHYWDESEISIR
jgi:hypothetical protein